MYVCTCVRQRMLGPSEKRAESLQHTRHILPPSEMDLGAVFGLILQAWKGNIYFTEQAERVEYV